MFCCYHDYFFGLKKIQERLLLLTMSFAISLDPRFSRNISRICIVLRSMCSGSVKDPGGSNGRVDSTLDWDRVVEGTLLGVPSEVSDDDDEQAESRENFSPRRRFFEDVRCEVDRVIEVLQQDGPGFDTKLALSELRLRVSTYLVRQVFTRILRSINHSNKDRCARLGYKFFVWLGEQKKYRHTSNTYHLVMKIFADCEEYKAMWNLLDVMTENGFPTTARTFNILVCTCGEAGLARKAVEMFIKSKTFNFRPFKHSFNAILHSLIAINQYRLIEWVYQQMILENQSPDILTYNVLIFAKYKLGKMDQIHRLLDELTKNGFSPDIHTYNILLHILGGANNPAGALTMINHMSEVGCEPRVIHFTSIIDGLSRAGKLEACEYFFFDEMVKRGCTPDVVCYTVMITGYVVAGEFEKAQALFDDMIIQGQLPNVFTYNAMIRGLCAAKKFEEARAMLREMESRGCKPNFVVYSTLLSNLRRVGKHSEAHEIIEEMVEKGHYFQLLSKYKGSLKSYRRC